MIDSERLIKAQEEAHDENVVLVSGSANRPENSARNQEAVRVKLGLAISSSEYEPSNIERIRQEYLAKKTVTFRAEQFRDEVVEFEVVDVVMLPEASASLFDEALTESLELGNRSLNSNSIFIVVDIGGGSTDIAAMQGVEVMPSSEEVYYIGANSALEEIALRVETKYNLEFGYLDSDYMDLMLRYPVPFCEKCGKTDKNPGPCACGGEFQLRRNILKLGNRAVDISDIVNDVYEEKADKLAEIFIRYSDRLFRTRGINKTQLDNVVFSGGGSEIFYEYVKERIQSSVGSFVEIIKSDKPTWKVLNGLSKYVLFKEKRANKNFDRYIFVDPGNFNLKAKCADSEGNDVIKPIVMLTKTAAPLEKTTLSVRKPNPMMDLDLDIQTVGGKKPGDGRFFVSYLANKGRNPKSRDMLIPKMSDDITNTMVNAAIGVVLARDKARG